MLSKFYKPLLLSGIFMAATVAATAQDNAPVEKNKANTDYKPAFAGQTRGPGVKSKTAYTSTVLSTTLKNPWGLRTLPDGRLLLSGKSGTMQILATDGTVEKDITGFPAVQFRDQGGLLDIALDPAFAKNRMLYWTYAQPGEGATLAVAKGKLSADETKLEDVKVIWEATPRYRGAGQFGSRIVFDKQGNLFVSVGDRQSNEIRVKAQDLTSTLGKIVHITPEGKPVANGPFAGKEGTPAEIYALGFRNPDGLTMNPATGDLWEVEFGPRGGDELNLIKAGQNYGWPFVTYGIEYGGSKVYDGIQQKEGTTQPVYYWDPVISPGCLVFYTGNIAEWKGNLLVGGLSGNHIIRLVIKDNKVVGEERLLEDKRERWRCMTIGKDGAIYAGTDGGKLYKIAKQ
ncbi:PQQ-dependent sugar dehydrogenase [Mucilaginibacter myungsuensis]|uniref:PQQ-dependent sugar dehydrogenase n=1 Tax=Mucilaginibacter myungsuensis TaxID=649104 RepID=A0A929KY77_9SPHI|nr:PQQ-dependent sugar dehydrogenase [Mucilaginibacter myungsuensis]MBE9662108.1 PQQ-dependent sugar dehydrogenase [Mucilaginibacter myungsuensis]MDN3599458.1 PQQ-dependent sugar dehydrogenase [Mucilaginibacter myungsuensis]